MNLSSLHAPQMDGLNLQKASAYSYIGCIGVNPEGVSLHGVPQHGSGGKHFLHLTEGCLLVFSTLPLYLFSSRVQSGELPMKYILGCNGKSIHPSLENSVRCKHLWGWPAPW